MATKTAKKYLVGGLQGEWYYPQVYTATSPEEALKEVETMDDINIGEKFNVYEVVGKPVVLESALAFVKAKEDNANS